jgi:hypothetical protein
MLTQRLASFLNVSTGATFCENYCALVVDSLAERLHVTGFATGDDATDALLRTHKAIKHIAAEVGFQNEKSFMRAFKGWTGVTPEGVRSRRPPQST